MQKAHPPTTVAPKRIFAAPTREGQLAVDWGGAPGNVEGDRSLNAACHRKALEATAPRSDIPDDFVANVLRTHGPE